MEATEPPTDAAELPGIPLDWDPDEINNMSLADIADTTDGLPEDTQRRVAPTDGTRLLVAASFNSAI